MAGAALRRVERLKRMIEWREGRLDDYRAVDNSHVLAEISALRFAVECINELYGWGEWEEGE